MKLSFAVGGETVDGHHTGQAKYLSHVLHMLEQIGHAFFQSIQIFRAQLVFGRAAVVFERANGSHYHYRIGGESRHAALDVKELFRSQISAKARLGDSVISKLHGHSGGHNGVAAMGNVGKGPAVDEGRGAFQRLNQVGFESILQQSSHSAFCL